ncbi:cysteine hydrolase family protein [Iodobacter sp.]|uniref:cysteine hydrolase family protein n=1 Tax=Iodobacter sp. TaxID=1915058 RepID=UPI0025F0AB03|nr:isochorismatase family protein [Iodobacter sp.]
MSKTALIVIDVQQSFLHRPFWVEDDVPEFQQNISQLIEACVAKNVPIVRIFHVSSGVFALESGLVIPLDWLPPQHDVVFHKHVHNAFSDTGLDYWLRKRNITKLLITGIRTEQCCETTARIGSDMGYEVDFISDATLTFAMQHAQTGRILSAAEIKERTEVVLAGRFANIVSTKDCINAL